LWKDGDSLNNANEAFYRRFTLPEERKNRTLPALEWCGGYRWFASPNVVKLEDHRPPGEMRRILDRLHWRKRDREKAAAANILAKAKRRLTS
jgi:hypothetical protein